MSLTGVRIISAPIVVQEVEGVLYFHGLFRLSALVNGVDTGEGNIPVEGTTESEVRSLMAQAQVENANLNSSNAEEFVATDVIGGAI